MIPRRITIDVSGWQPHKGRTKRNDRPKVARPAKRQRKGLSATLAERVIDRQVARASDG